MIMYSGSFVSFNMPIRSHQIIGINYSILYRFDLTTVQSDPIRYVHSAQPSPTVLKDQDQRTKDQTNRTFQRVPRV